MAHPPTTQEKEEIENLLQEIFEPGKAPSKQAFVDTAETRAAQITRVEGLLGALNASSQMGKLLDTKLLETPEGYKTAVKRLDLVTAAIKETLRIGDGPSKEKEEEEEEAPTTTTTHDMDEEELDQHINNCLFLQDYQGALCYLKDMLNKTADASWPKRIAVQYNIAMVAHAMGMSGWAQEELTGLASLSLTQLGKHHGHTLMIMQQLGLICFETGHPRSALRFLDRVFDWNREAYGPFTLREYLVLKYQQRILKSTNQAHRLAEVEAEIKDVLKVHPGLRETTTSDKEEAEKKTTKPTTPAPSQLPLPASHPDIQQPIAIPRLCAHCGDLPERVCTDCDDVCYCSKKCERAHAPIHTPHCSGKNTGYPIPAL